MVAAGTSTRPVVFSGTPLEDAREFRRCLGQFGTGVTIITASGSGGLVGVTANSFASVSLDPPLILWSISRTSRSFDGFLEATHFAINILASEQIGLSQHFSSAAIDKFVGIDFCEGEGGAPVLGNVLAHLECSVENKFDAGDHVIVLGRVLRFAVNQGESLIFSQGRYRAAVDHPEIAMRVEEPVVPAEIDLSDGKNLFHFIYWAFHRMSERFDVYRHKVGLTVPQIRVLVHVLEQPGALVSDIVRTRFLTSKVAEDAVEALIEQGAVARRADGTLRITRVGEDLRRRLADGEDEFDRDQMRDIPATDLAVARRVLKQLIKRNSA